MMFRDVLTLITEHTQGRGAFEQPTAATKTDVFCTVRSVGMSEAYQAMANGLNPQYVFILSDYSDYGDQKIVVFHDVMYRVIRTYRSGQSIELTCEEIAIDRTVTIPTEVETNA